MKFSIIIPAHNAAEYIHRALDSVQAQTYTNYELIVVCDACNDDTAQVARRYTDTVIECTHYNDGMARNEGLDVAAGEYVLFMDADDWWLHEYVLWQLSHKLSGEDVLLFSFIFKGVQYAPPKVDGNHWIAVWNKAWRREFIGDTRFTNVYAISDKYFDEAMWKKSPVTTDWDMPMYYYNYMREGSISWRLQNT